MLDNTLECLLDTGADIPVWVGSLSELKRLYNARLVKKDTCFSGFGGSNKCDLYYIDFYFSSVTESLIFPEMPIAVLKEFDEYPFNMILSASMFYGLIYEIDTVQSKLKITIKDGCERIRKLNIRFEGKNTFSIYLASTYKTLDEYKDREDTRNIAASFRDLYFGDN